MREEDYMKYTMDGLRAMVKTTLRAFSAIVGRRFDVQFVKGKEIGYTELTDDNRRPTKIVLNPDPIIFHIGAPDLDDDRKYLFVKGVLIHEIGHSIYTDPQAAVRCLKRHSKSPVPEQPFRTINNIIEDLTLETRLGNGILSDALVKSLHFSIYTIWRKSGEVEMPDNLSTYTQVINGLVDFTDMGVVHDRLNDEAKKVLWKIIPMVYKAVGMRPDERAEVAYKVTAILASYFNEAPESEQQMGRNLSGSAPTGSNAAASKERLDEDELNSLTPESVKKMGASDSKEAEDAHTNDGADAKPSGDAANDDSEKTSKDGQSLDYDWNQGIDPATVESEFESTIEDVRAEIEEAVAKAQAPDGRNIKDAEKALDIPGVKTMVDKGQPVKCINKLIANPTDKAFAVYEQIKTDNLDAIQILSKSLRSLAEQMGNREWKTSGLLNAERCVNMANTPRVFGRYTSVERKNSRVLLLIDVSGSMAGARIQCARQAAIVIAEAMNSAGLPLKVITFSDNQNNDVVHRHYVNWKSGPNAIAPLADIKDEWSNFDGYSIRYATADLLRQKAEHRLLIVVSDGQPACAWYRGADGIADTKAAINEAKKKLKVIGVGIGADLPILKAMYKETFVQMTDLRTLSTDLGKLIKREVATW